MAWARRFGLLCLLAGAAVLAGCAAVFECELATQQTAGDHRLFIGRVLGFSESALPLKIAE